MKKALNILKDVLVALFVGFTIIVMLFTISTVFFVDKEEGTDFKDNYLFGLKGLTVLSPSMEPEIMTGDLIIIKKVDESNWNDLKAGDTITFQSPDKDSPSFGQTITHKIREVTKDENGNLAFVTYGINTGVDDPVPVSAGLVYGKYVARLPAAGSFLVFLKEPQGYIICILIPFLLLILYHGIKTIKLFRQYKKEQNAELQAERDEIAAERAESQRMLEELAALKAQLAAQGGATPADSEPMEPQAASTESEPTESESTEETPSKDAE